LSASLATAWGRGSHVLRGPLSPKRPIPHLPSQPLQITHGLRGIQASGIPIQYLQSD
jgi:hypothetical protein